MTTHLPASPLRILLALVMAVATALTAVTLNASSANAVTTPTVSGQIFGVDGRYAAAGVAVRFYRSTGDESAPWELAETVRSGPDGNFQTTLPAGTYKASFNEMAEATAAWRTYFPRTWRLGDMPKGLTTFTVAGYNLRLSTTRLSQRGGSISGTFDDQCDDVPRGLTMQAFAADDPDPAHAYTQTLTGRTYSIHTFDGPTKFRVTSPEHGTTWLGGTDFASATAFDLGEDEEDDGPTLALTRTFDTSGTGRVYDSVHGFENRSTSGLVVRFYRSQSGADGPWLLESQTTTSSNGSYDATLPAGVYRLTYNETADGSLVSKQFGSALYEGFDKSGPANLCVATSSVTRLATTEVGPPAGTITGQVTTHRGTLAYGAKVELFDANDPAGAAATPIFTTQTNGTYSIPAIDGPAKLRVTSAPTETNGFEPTWSGGAADFASATTVTAAAGQTTAGNNIVMTDGQFALTADAYVAGTQRYGQVLQSKPPRTKFSPAIFTRQWLRTVKGVTKPIRGATGSTYRLTHSDVGARVSVRVTATAPVNYPGVAPHSSTSEQTTTIRRKSEVLVSAKANGGRNFTMTVAVAVDGVKNPDGKVELSWVYLKQRGNRLYPTGAVKYKVVSYNNGKATYRAKVSKKGYWAFGGYQPETSTVLADGHFSRFLKVK